MELTPELLIEARFSRAKPGYDMAEVDDFLERCAEGLEILVSRLTAEFERAEAAEALLAARPAAPVADATVVAPPVAEPKPAPAPAPVAAPSEAVEEPMRVLILAERTAAAAVAEAKAEADRIRSEAESLAQSQRTKAETLVARAQADAEVEARRVGDEIKRGIEAEVIELRRDRDGLTDDIRNLRRWLDEQRARMRTTARDLQRLVEDPAALRDFPLPATPEPGQSADTELTPPEADLSDEAGPDAGEPTQAVPVVDANRPNPSDPFAGDSGSSPI